MYAKRPIKDSEYSTMFGDSQDIFILPRETRDQGYKILSPFDVIYSLQIMLCISCDMRNMYRVGVL
jgi:hypothetical protein